MAGGLGSASSATGYVESAAGVGEGARTGIASIVTGLGFLLAMFLSPIVSIIPSEAAAPVLVFVGFLMMAQVTHIDWKHVEEGLPAFLGMVLMPLIGIPVRMSLAFAGAALCLTGGVQWRIEWGRRGNGGEGRSHLPFNADREVATFYPPPAALSRSGSTTAVSDRSHLRGTCTRCQVQV